jgi:TorA maturation chaperone TorD
MTATLLPLLDPGASGPAYQPLDPALQRARQVIYRFLGLALLDPRRGSWPLMAKEETGDLAVQAAELLREEPAALCYELTPRERPLADLDPGVVLRHLPRSPTTLNAIYELVFGLLASGPCPPYATEFIAEKLVFQRSNALADIAGYYHAFGVETSPENPERPDHIVLQLEFMALLIDLELRAAASGSDQGIARAEVCRAAQHDFLRDHLAWWTPAFARLLEFQQPGGFYAAVGQVLAAFIPAERALLNVPAPSGAPRPSRVEHPEACSGCGIL